MSQNLDFWANVSTIPLQAVPSQTLQITLGSQACSLNVYGRQIQVPYQNPNQTPATPPVYEVMNPVFVDLFLNGVLVIGGVLARNGVRIVRDAYLNFVGDLVWYDLQPGTDGPTDPIYTGIGTRYILTYWPFLVGFGVG